MPDGEDGGPYQVYADGYSFQANQYTIHLSFTLGFPAGGEVRQLVTVHMSPEHAKVMAILFKRNVKGWEESFDVEIPIPARVLSEHSISLEQDW